MTPQDFIAKWGAPGGVPGPAYALNEEQGAQSHFLDLCELLGVDKPRDPDNYCFERGAGKASGGDGWADVLGSSGTRYETYFAQARWPGG